MYKIVLIHYKVNIYRYNSRLTHLSVSSAKHIGRGKQCYPRFLQDQINQRMHSYLQLIKHKQPSLHLIRMNIKTRKSTTVYLQGA